MEEHFELRRQFDAMKRLARHQKREIEKFQKTIQHLESELEEYPKMVESEQQKFEKQHFCTDKVSRELKTEKQKCQ